MPRVRRPGQEVVVLAALLLCGVVREVGSLTRSAGRAREQNTAHSRVAGSAAAAMATGGPRLPEVVDGVPGRPLAFGPSERLLADLPEVSVTRRAYGPTLVALVSTTGIREIHPPRVCLAAIGLEVVQRAEERIDGGCLVHLKVRGSGGTSHFLHTYLGQGKASCRFWSRAGKAMAARLAGRSRRWSTLQVMDRDARRARRVLAGLLPQLSAPPTCPTRLHLSTPPARPTGPHFRSEDHGRQR